MITRSRRAQFAAAGIITTLALAGCGGSDDDSGSDTTAAAATTAADAATTTAGSDTTTGGAETTAGGADTTAGGGAMAVEVDAVNYAFEDLPETVPAGTTLGLTNSSTDEVHELLAFLLPEDEERSVEDLVLLPEAELEALFGTAEPATVIIAPPGEAGTPVVGDGSLTEPGRYAIICAIPIGADPAEYMAAAQSGEGPPQVEGGPPHFTAGMWAEVTVE